MLPMILRINRQGEFIAQPEVHETQCGKQGARHYKYFVTIEANNSVLTKDGFVMENMWVADYFRETYEDPNTGRACDSCENMAQRAVEHFVNMFDGRKGVKELKNIQLQRVYVRIHGSDVSYIEAEWHR